MAIFSSRDRKQEVIEEILLKNYNRYYRLAFSYVQNAADAEDIVQNGAYKAILNSASVKHEEFAGTWVYRIILNETFRVLRQRKEESLEELGFESGCEDTYFKEEEMLDLKKALDSLPEKDKAVIILRYFEDQKLEDIAAVLNEKVGTVKSRLYRSLKKMRLKLESENEDGMYRKEQTR